MTSGMVSGLTLNRAQFLAHVAGRLAALPDPFPDMAIITVVLPGIAAFHQTYGAAAAEELLRRVFGAIRRFAPETAIGRISDGQFALTYELDTEWTNVQDVAADLIAAIDGSGGEQPVLLEAPNIGAVVHSGKPPPGTLLELATELLRQANLAVQIAPRIGQDGFMLYSPAVDERVRSATILDQSLRQAITRQEFRLYYQPLVDMRSFDLAGLEGLIRWENPVTGLRGPDDFIAAAENSGLILPIGAAVLDIALRQARAWITAGWAPPRVAVNVSPQQLKDPNFCTIVANALSRCDLKPAALELEITERTFITWSKATRRVFEDLHEMGVTLALDDFGTGYSSLQYLRDMPISKLKIDRAFIRRIALDQRDAAVVKTIVGLGHALNLTVVAEGIEQVEQAEALLDCGCHLAQGYLFSRPVPNTEVPGLQTTLSERHRMAPLMANRSAWVAGREA